MPNNIIDLLFCVAATIVLAPHVARLAYRFADWVTPSEQETSRQHHPTSRRQP